MSLTLCVFVKGYLRMRYIIDLPRSPATDCLSVLDSLTERNVIRTEGERGGESQTGWGAGLL